MLIFLKHGYEAISLPPELHISSGNQNSTLMSASPSGAIWRNYSINKGLSVLAQNQKQILITQMLLMSLML